MMIAIDIGGTFTRYKIGKKIVKLSTKEIDLIAFLESLIKKYKIKKMAISFAGQVNNNKILSSPNTSFQNIDLKKLELKYKIKIILENDMNCAVLAESKYFSEKYIVALYSGTGIGSGVIENGKIIRGYKNLAGEIGHIPYKKTPFLCKCGKNNCIELFASGSGIQKWNKYLSNKKIKKNYIKALLVAIGSIITLFNPKILVLGGGVIINNKDFFEEILKRKDNFIPNFSNTQIKLTKLEEASLFGAEILLQKEKK